MAFKAMRTEETRDAGLRPQGEHVSGGSYMWPRWISFQTARLSTLFLLVMSTAVCGNELTIVAFGDSTTAPRSTVKQVYSARLPSLLQLHGIEAKVINSGVGGSHTGRLSDNARHRRKHALDRFDDAVRVHEPDVVIVQFGWNDSWIDADSPDSPSRIPVNDYGANLKNITDTLKRDGSKVILMTPNRPSAAVEDWRLMRTQQYVDAVRELAASDSIPLVDIWAEYEQFSAVEGNESDDLLLDAVHPNDQGHQLVARLLANAISDLEATKANRPNILFIAIDDLRPELGCYGASHIHSPNIDALAASGRLFQRAYCQQAVCNPSRTSLMTGMRPDSIGVTGNHSHFRSNHPDVVTLPQHFKRHGYHAAAIGKIYHGVFSDGTSITKWDTMGDPESWSVPAVRFGPRYYYTEEGIAAAIRSYERVYKPQNPAPDDWTKKLVFGPATEAPDVPDNTLYDGQVADAAVTALRELSDSEKPFFLAVGFIKPHSPHIAPKKYFDLYPEVELPADDSFPSDAPTLAGHRSSELRRYTDQPKSGEIPKLNQRRIRQAYFACVSYIDFQVGRVLDELDRSGLTENTVVVLWGDHGYHLGEHQLWGKTTNFELDTRVPLIVRTPDMKAAGQPSLSIIELVDLYPTLAEVAGLPVTKQLEGKSFARILNEPTATTKTMAISQYPRRGGLMGYSMRTEMHRLTQWLHGETNEIHATELYEYAEGLIEKKNIAAQAPLLVARLSNQLESALRLDFIEPKEVMSDSFEEANPGPLEKLETHIGTWMPMAGRTIVDDKHARTGKQCLWLTGGQSTSAIINLDEKVDTSGQLRFWAERWTVRKPFSFRIEKQTGSGWREIYNGDDDVRVGRGFLSRVILPLSDDMRQLRFSVTSPPNTGVLIDDLRITPGESEPVPVH